MKKKSKSKRIPNEVSTSRPIDTVAKRAKQSKKRILSITIRRMIDLSPDSSHMGEYANRPTSKYSIDRAHSEDCPLNSVLRFDSADEWSDWNGRAEDALNRVRLFLESFEASVDHESSLNGCHEDCSACAEEQPYHDATDAVWELERVASKCDCHGRDLGRHELRYFNPSFNYVDKNDKPRNGLTPEEVRKYIHQDYERMEGLDRCDWCYIGIRAEAEIGIVAAHSHVTGEPIYTIQRLTSGGLWGIESDSDKSYLESVEQEQLADLKQVLKELGFSSRAIGKAFKNVERKDS